MSRLEQRRQQIAAEVAMLEASGFKVEVSDDRTWIKSYERHGRRHVERPPAWRPWDEDGDQGGSILRFPGPAAPVTFNADRAAALAEARAELDAARAPADRALAEGRAERSAATPAAGSASSPPARPAPRCAATAPRLDHSRCGDTARCRRRA